MAAEINFVYREASLWAWNQWGQKAPGNPYEEDMPPLPMGKWMPNMVRHPLAHGTHSYHLRVHGACLHSSLALLVAHQRPRELVDQLSGMMMGHKHLDEGNPIKHKH